MHFFPSNKLDSGPIHSIAIQELSQSSKQKMSRKSKESLPPIILWLNTQGTRVGSGGRERKSPKNIPFSWVEIWGHTENLFPGRGSDKQFIERKRDKRKNCWVVLGFDKQKKSVVSGTSCYHLFSYACYT